MSSLKNDLNNGKVVRMLAKIGFFVLVLSISFSRGSLLLAQNVGDTVRLESTSTHGVPVHPAAGDNSFVRWANGTIGNVTSIDSATGWLQITSFGKVGWVIKRYLTVIPPDPPTDGDSPSNELLTYVIGTWNLEHFNNGATRGFPENGQGGPSYAPRTDEDYRLIIRIITEQLGAKILVLNEINGKSGLKVSDEMDRLVSFLGNDWSYELSLAGENERIAILYNTAAVRKDSCTEFEVPVRQIQGKDIFARDPLACKFTLFDATQQPKNDLVVVGLHLASGQHLNQNHNAAMAELRNRLHQAFSNGTFSAAEKDIFIAGDMNANRYDNKLENFWEGFDASGFNFLTLSPDDGELYEETRLGSVPLHPHSKIDYLIASNGLSGELVQLIGEVHTELLSQGFDLFRAHVSDHIPVTARIRVVPDND
jgi:endonuclease/exonuclease/phosphatase family metal-dependent hydrolase